MYLQLIGVRQYATPRLATGRRINVLQLPTHRNKQTPCGDQHVGTPSIGFRNRASGPTPMHATMLMPGWHWQRLNITAGKPTDHGPFRPSPLDATTGTDQTVRGTYAIRLPVKDFRETPWKSVDNITVLRGYDNRRGCL
ncbi:MAG: hypothetical protein L0Z68_01260 [Gammaproteobacteria bacterium]|nr:hypothetical protein [Gammaproteobacteria bacterium]